MPFREIGKQQMCFGLPSEFWAGLIGSIVGGILTIAGGLLKHHLENRAQKELDRKRRDTLKRMLEGDQPWRRLETLSRVIGADHETTKRLLFELGARGSEEGNEVWALISRMPLPTTDNDT